MFSRKLWKKPNLVASENANEWITEVEAIFRVHRSVPERNRLHLNIHNKTKSTKAVTRLNFAEAQLIYLSL
jgi:hypothetical protein